jgi:CheY-like chemotaxis protein
MSEHAQRGRQPWQPVAVAMGSVLRCDPDDAPMTAPTRILLVEDSHTEWRLALSALSEAGCSESAAVVSGSGEALDFLHGRGTFRSRPDGLPAVVVIGPTLSSTRALTLLRDIKSDAHLRRIPAVVVTAEHDPETTRRAYEHGANGLMRADQDTTAHGLRYATLARFWARTNEPPPPRSARGNS